MKRRPHALTLAQGDQIVVAEGPTHGLVTLIGSFGLGAAEDRRADGGTCSAWAMTQRGTALRSRSAWVQAMERCLAQFDVQTTLSRVRWQLRVPRARLEAALDLVEEAFFRAADDPASWRELQEDTDEWVRQTLETPEGALERQWRRSLWPRSRWGRPVEGFARYRQLRSARASAELEEIRRRSFAAPWVFGLAAEDAGALVPELEARFARWRAERPLTLSARSAAPPVAMKGRRSQHVEVPWSSQHALWVIHAMPPASDPAWPTYQLLAAAFGRGFLSPLLSEIRGRLALSYHVGAVLIEGAQGSLWSWELEPEGDRVLEAYDALRAVWDAWLNAGWDAARWELVRRALIGGTLVEREPTDARLRHALRLVDAGRPLDAYGDDVAAWQSIDGEVVLNAARNLGLSSDHLVLSAGREGPGARAWEDRDVQVARPLGVRALR